MQSNNNTQHSGDGGGGGGDGNHNNNGSSSSHHQEPQHHVAGGGGGGHGGAISSRASTRRTGPLRSVEGWVVFVTGVHEEAQEDDLLDAFSEHGTVKKVQINVDRQTGLAKGYALVEYMTQSEAQDAINTLHGTNVLGKNIGVHWAFVKPTGHGGSDATPSRDR